MGGVPSGVCMDAWMDAWMHASMHLCIGWNRGEISRGGWGEIGGGNRGGR